MSTDRAASSAMARRREPGEWSSSTSASGSLTLTPWAKMAQVSAITSAGHQLISARSHGCPRRYVISRAHAPRTPAMNTESAPVDEHGHPRAQSIYLFDRPRAHFEGLDVVAARLPRRSPRRIFALGADVVDGERDDAVTQGGHSHGDSRC